MAGNSFISGSKGQGHEARKTLPALVMALLWVLASSSLAIKLPAILAGVLAYFLDVWLDLLCLEVDFLTDDLSYAYFYAEWKSSKYIFDLLPLVAVMALLQLCYITPEWLAARRLYELLMGFYIYLSGAAFCEHLIYWVPIVLEVLYYRHDGCDEWVLYASDCWLNCLLLTHWCPGSSSAA